MKKVLLLVVGMLVVCGGVYSMIRISGDKVEEQGEPEELGIGMEMKEMMMNQENDEMVKAGELNAFGFRVFREVAEGKNVFLSPMSLTTALSLLSGGSAGRTEEAMLKTLGLTGWTREQAGAYFRKLTEALQKADDKTTVEFANSVWLHSDVELKQEFARFADENYDAEVATADFDAKATLDRINGWCSDKTHGKINSILGQLNSDTKMLLLNALYFNGSWRYPFSYSFPGVFHALDGGTPETELMEETMRISYYEDEAMQAVSLPYGNGSYAAVLILPREEVDFRKFAKGFDEAAWERIMQGMVNERVHLTVPKFRMEYEVNLNETLKALGMSVAFTNAADFSGLSPKALKIGLVKQKTFVDFHEKGTEAAAVTAIGMLEATAVPIDPFEFRADRPFLLAIRERSTGAVLFLGQKVE